MISLMTMTVSAKSLRQLWIDMPDSIVPYLNKNLRTEFVDFVDMKVKADVKNLFDQNSRMDTLTNDYLKVTLNESATLEMKLFSSSDGKDVLCLVKTFSAPEKESELVFFDSSWNQLNTSDLFSGVQLDKLPGQLVQKPDTMSQERFEKLKILIEPEMTWNELNIGENSITFNLATPLMSNDDKKAVDAILVQRKFKWNGKTFN